MIDTLTSHIDLAPTICGFADVEPSGNVPLPGLDLGPLLKGSQRDVHPEGVFAEAGGPPAMQSIICNIDGGTWKYTRYLEETENGLELYNLTDDIKELDNKALGMPVTVSRLQSSLEEWYASTTPDAALRRPATATISTAIGK